MLSSRRATLCARPEITWKLFVQNFPPGFTHSSCLQHVHVEIKTKRTTSKKKKKKHSGFIDKLEKNQWKPHIKLPEASLGTGLRHPVIFHHKMLKMGHCLWHVLSSLATLHLTRSKTKKEKKAFKSPNKKHMASHSITAIFSPASLTRTTCSLLH